MLHVASQANPKGRRRSMPTTTDQTTTMRRNRRGQRARRTLALACTLPALAASTAAAQPQHSAGLTSGGQPPPTLVQVTAPSGFDWGDAGIGAAAGLAISLIAVGGALTVFRRRDHETRASIGAAH
jgi:hypothetical protein